MTHEEAAVQLVREYASTYSRYPFMIYQIQTKFRDEARPRRGTDPRPGIHHEGRLFLHTSQEDLESYYARCLRPISASLPGPVSRRWSAWLRIPA